MCVTVILYFCLNSGQVHSGERAGERYRLRLDREEGIAGEGIKSL